jgi:hypothetical protein
MGCPTRARAAAHFGKDLHGQRLARLFVLEVAQHG